MADTTGERTNTQGGESGVMNNDNNLSETVVTESFIGNIVEDKTAALEQRQQQQLDHSSKDDQPLANAVVTSAYSATTQLQIITDRALQFLSHASNETIGACLVGLGATTYLVLGRVGLMLIGLVGGIALHASWDAHGETDRAAAREKEQKKKRELGLEVVQRVFQWKSETPFNGDDSDEEELQLKAAVPRKKLDFSTFQPQTAVALTAFTDAIIQDYVKYAKPFLSLFFHTTDIDTSQMVVRSRLAW